LFPSGTIVNFIFIYRLVILSEVWMQQVYVIHHRKVFFCFH